MIIKVDNTGKIVIPEAFVAALELKENDSVNIAIDNFRQKIVINREIPSCIFCRAATDLIQISGKYVCGCCRDRLASSAVGDCLY